MQELDDLHPPSLATSLDQLNELIAELRKILSAPPPDTFLGRKTQEPFPNEGDLQGCLSRQSRFPRCDSWQDG